MNILISILNGLTGVAIMIVVFNLFIAIRSRDIINYAFVLIGLGMLIYIPCNSLLYQVIAPAEYLRILKIQMYGTTIYHIGLIILFGHYLNISIKWPLAIYTSLFIFFLIARQINPMLTYDSFTGMTEYVTIWQEKLYLPLSSASMWGNLYAAMLLSIYFYLFTLAIRQFRVKRSTNSVRMLIGAITLILAVINDFVVFIFNLPWLFIADISLVVVVLMMEIILTDDLIKVNSLTRELNDLNAHLEDRIRIRTAQLEEANRELETFANSIAHDLRAPLRAIDGYSKIIRNEFDDTLPPDFHEYFTKIESASTHMGALIDALLELARISRKVPRRLEIDTEPLVRAVSNSLSTVYGEREIIWVIGKLPTMNADPVLMRQVFHNLLENAAKFTEPNRVAQIEIGCLEQDGKVVYFVKDNGVGFNMEYSEKVFMLFQRLHNNEEFEGLGIGLAIAKRIIQLHGGSIWFDSQPGVGTTFYFHIPS